MVGGRPGIGPAETPIAIGGVMKVSVITASFNQGGYIQKCVDSVRRQVGDFELEHIILDNCSNDGTAEILDDYKNNPCHVSVKVLVKPDAGQTTAINEGFSLAKGDIVCWLNTDEWYEDNALQSVVNFFKRNPQVDVMFGDCDFVDKDGNLVKEKREYFYSQSMLIFYGCFIPSCSTFIRRRVLDDGIYLDPHFKVTMDFDWYVRIAKAGYRFAHLPSTLASFTWHDTNISSVFVERRLQERKMVQDRYSGVKGPAWFQSLVYAFIFRFWLVVRVTRRFRSTL